MSESLACAVHKLHLSAATALARLQRTDNKGIKWKPVLKTDRNYSEAAPTRPNLNQLNEHGHRTTINPKIAAMALAAAALAISAQHVLLMRDR